jgi:hypothetical protein
MIYRLKSGNYIFLQPAINYDFEYGKIKSVNRGIKNNASIDEDKKEKNRKRMRKERFIRFALNNDFKYFITLTYDRDKYNNDTFVSSVKQHFRRYYNKYILVPEYHSDSIHIHYHILTDNIPFKLYINGEGFLQCDKYIWGFHKINIIDSSSDNYINVVYYLSKYLTKDLTLKNTYSRNLSNFCDKEIINLDTKIFCDLITVNNYVYSRFLVPQKNVK